MEKISSKRTGVGSFGSFLICLYFFIFASPLAFAGIAVLQAPAPEPDAIGKSRYISFVPRNAGEVTAIRVELTSLNHPNPPATGGISQDFSAFEGEVRWVGPVTEYVDSALYGTTYRAARLQCTPYYTDWSGVGVIHVYGTEIVPDSVYQVQAIFPDCSIDEEACYSQPLQVVTGRWGDLVPPYSTPGGTVQPDFSDIAAMVNKFKNSPDQVSKPIAQLAGYPNSVDPLHPIDFTEISLTVDAFRGRPYLYPGPEACPPAKAVSTRPTISSAIE